MPAPFYKFEICVINMDDKSMEYVIISLRIEI